MAFYTEDEFFYRKECVMLFNIPYHIDGLTFSQWLQRQYRVYDNIKQINAFQGTHQECRKHLNSIENQFKYSILPI